MIDQSTEKGIEGRGRDLIDVISRHFTGRINLSQEERCPC
jgi:hypothetical protein